MKCPELDYFAGVIKIVTNYIFNTSPLKFQMQAFQNIPNTAYKKGRSGTLKIALAQCICSSSLSLLRFMTKSLIMPSV